MDPLSRRGLLGAGVGAAIGLGATTAPAAAREVDPELVAHWTRLMGVLDRHDAMFGPRDVLDAVRRELDLIAAHRRVARGDLRVQLLRVEGRWSQFASWLSGDSGDAQLRDSWARRALQLAREGEWPDLIAYVLMRRSRWAIEEHDAHRALMYAAAAHRTPGMSTEVRALCALKKAHAHAMGDDVAACERSLAEAYALLGRVGQGEAAGPWGDVASQELTAPYVMAADARCWLWLRPRKAVGMFDDALKAWPRDRARSGGVHRARLALACARADEPDRAVAEGMAAVDVARSTHSALTVRELQRLEHRLGDYDVPGAADFREAFATL